MNTNGSGPFSTKDGLRLLASDYLLRMGASQKHSQIRFFSPGRGTLTFPAESSPLGTRTIEIYVSEIRNPGGKRVLVHGMVGGVKSSVIAIRD